MEKLFESSLWCSRLVLILAVLSCLVSSAGLILLGVYEVIHLFDGLYHFVIVGSDQYTRDGLIFIVIEVLDTFLLSSILMIFAFGIYELFISPIEHVHEHTSQVFQITSIDDLKAKLGKVIIMLLVIKVFAMMLEIKPVNMLEIVYQALIVLLVAISLWLGHKKG